MVSSRRFIVLFLCGILLTSGCSRSHEAELAKARAEAEAARAEAAKARAEAEDAASIVGTWESGGTEVTYKADGTFSTAGSLLSTTGKWKVAGGKLVTTSVGFSGVQDKIEQDYSVTKETLTTIYQGKQYTWKRKQ